MNATSICANVRSRRALILLHLYPSWGHQEALGYIRYGIEGHAGFVVLTGEIGAARPHCFRPRSGH